MKVVAILAWAVLTSARLNECVDFVCDPPGVTWSQNACAMLSTTNDTQIDLRTDECQVNQICPAVYVVETGQNSVTCMNPQSPGPVSVALPGERCDILRICIQGVCEEGACSTSVPCINVYDCGLAQYCDEGTCLALVAIGGACTLDTDCVNNAACDIVVEGLSGTGKCVQYNSVAAGQSVQSCATFATNLAPHPLCSSGYCYETATAGQFACSGSLTSPTPPPNRCSESVNYCVSAKDYTSGLTLTTYCECGYDGYAYCPLFPGDLDYSFYASDLQTFISSSLLSNCNTARHSQGSFQPGNYFWCGMNFTRTQTYHYLRAILYPEVVMATNCSIKILAPEYYNVTHEPEEKSFAMIGILVSGIYFTLLQ